MIDKIRKLLALADPMGGATEAEAASALEAAQRLMTRHRITEEEIRATGGDEAANLPGIEARYIGWLPAWRLWEFELMAAIGHVAGADVIRWANEPDPDGRDHNRGSVVKVIGRPSAADYVVLVTGWVKPQLEADHARAHRLEDLSRDALRRRRMTLDESRLFKRSFMLGAVETLGERLRALQAAEEAGTGLELVVSDRAALDAWYGPDKPTMQDPDPIDSTAAAYGAASGNSIDVDPGNKLVDNPVVELEKR